MVTRTGHRTRDLMLAVSLVVVLLLALGCVQRTAAPARLTVWVSSTPGEAATEVLSATRDRPATVLSDTSMPAPTWTATATNWPNTWTPAPTATPFPTATRVAQVTPLPTPSPTGIPDATATLETLPSPTPQPRATAAPNHPVPVAFVDEIVINTYDWQDALVGTEPEDAVYPYPRLDHGRIGPPTPRMYETVVLENEYTRLTLLPELGGRIYRWYDKPSGVEMFYVNPVIKPTQWGARGWWLGMGGMEWAFPVEEHGLVEWRPWSYEVQRDAQRVSVALATTDDRTGLNVEVVVSLGAGDASIAVAPRISNPTANEQQFQFWMNGMFALSPANRPNPDLRFSLPGRSVTVHSTGDPDAPAAGDEMEWPVHGGRDMSRYGNWSGWLGVFAWDADYMGAYDPVSGMGVVRACPADIARGAKVFGPATLSPGLWTDDGSGYVELWGGLTRTFWDYATLPAGGQVGWQERWYSANQLGGVTCANEQAALHLSTDADGVRVGAVTTMPRTGWLILDAGDRELAQWEVTTAPGLPVHVVHPATISGSWRLTLVDGSKARLLVCEGPSP